MKKNLHMPSKEGFTFNHSQKKGFFLALLIMLSVVAFVFLGKAVFQNTPSPISFPHEATVADVEPVESLIMLDINLHILGQVIFKV